MQTIRLLIFFLRPFAWSFPLLIVLGLAASLAEGVGIGLLIPLLNLMVQGEPSNANHIIGQVQDFFGRFDPEVRPALIGGCIFAAIVLKATIEVSYYGLAAWIRGQAAHQMRKQVLQQWLAVGFAFFLSQEIGRLGKILREETDRTSEAMYWFSKIIISACALAVFSVLLLILSWHMTLFLLTAVLTMSLIMRLFIFRVGQYGRNLVKLNSAMHEFLWNTMGAQRLIRLFNEEENTRFQFDRKSDMVRQTEWRLDLLENVVYPLTEVLYLPVFICVLLYAWHAGIGLPTLLAFLILAHRLHPHIRRIDECRVYLAARAAGVAEVAAALDRHDKPYIHSGSRNFDGLRHSISLNHVDFHYPGSARPALKNISFEIARGATLAIVGQSGAGKSTLRDLICRLYDPTGGKILIDSVPLPELDLVSWRQRLAVAGQDLDLLPCSVRDNITFGSGGTDEKGIEAAARQADAHDFICALPNGYDSIVGERGVRLSGGQRQRIGLARALLRRPDVLILDEATNALDGLSETAIQGALTAMRRQATIIIIAHRLSTVRNADQVVVLNRGRVVEHGRPESLVAAGGDFAELSRLQALETSA